jgi:hypothetical protein
MNKLYPNFFIVGAAKAGTTSLYHYLKTHEELYFAPIKEPHYFSSDIKTSEFNSIYKKNIEYIPTHFFKREPTDNLQNVFVRNNQHYLDLFKWVKNEKAVGECSTSYLYSKLAAENIHSFNPDSKIIIALRNPAERTFSHYLMAVRFGFTQLPFRKALEKDISQKKKGWGKSELFFELSLYHDQIKRYLDLFSENQVKVILFDDFKKDSLKTINEICDFLEISQVSCIDKKKHNAALMPKSKNLNRMLVNSGVKNKMSSILNEKTKDRLRQLFFQNSNIPKLNKEDRKYLNSYFKDDIEKTSALIQMDLSDWLK